MKLRTILIYILCALSTHLTAQDELLDSLAQKAALFSDDSLATAIYIQESKNQVQIDRDIADTILQIALRNLPKKNNTQHAQILTMRAQIALTAAQYESVEELVNTSDRILEEIDPNSEILLINLNIRGLSRYYQSDYDAALLIFFHRLRLAEKAANLPVQLRTLNNIGICYERLASNENALFYYQQALGIIENTPFDKLGLQDDNQRKYYLASVNANIGNIFFNQEKYTEALQNFEESYTAAKEINNKPLRADEAINIGRTLSVMNRHEESAKYHEEALAVANELNEPQRIILAQLNLAENLSKTGQSQKAIDHLLKAEELSEAKNIKEQSKSIYQNLQQSFTNLQNYKKALEYASKLSLLEDSLYTTEQVQITEDLNAKYQAAQKELALNNQELLISKQRTQRNRLWTGLLIVCLITALMWYYYQTKQNQAKQALLVQEHTIEHLQQEQKLLALDSILQGQEAERKRIAQDLHDGLGAILSSVRSKVAHINKEIVALKDMDIVGDTETLIIKACDEVRRISHDMMPASLISFGLVDAIEDLIEDVRNDGDVDVSSTIELNNMELPKGLQLQVYRILQEFINNTLKHASADKLKINLEIDDELLLLRLADNGIGYEKKETEGLDGLGRKGIVSRVRYIGGELHDHTKAGVGCILEITVPMRTSTG